MKVKYPKPEPRLKKLRRLAKEQKNEKYYR